MTVCDQVRKLLLHLLLWKPTVVVSGTWDWSSLLSCHVIHTGELGEAEKVGERSRHKGGSLDSSLGRFLLAGVFKADVIRIWVSPFDSLPGLAVTPLAPLCS